MTYDELNELERRERFRSRSQRRNAKPEEDVYDEETELHYSWERTDMFKRDVQPAIMRAIYGKDS